LDIDDSDSINRGVAYVLEKTGGTLDALFNNAGFAMPGAVEDIRGHDAQPIRNNVFGTMELTNRVIPVMRKQGHGRIIQNTSILGIIAMPYRGAYNASKFAWKLDEYLAPGVAILYSCFSHCAWADTESIS